MICLMATFMVTFLKAGTTKLSGTDGTPAYGSASNQIIILPHKGVQLETTVSNGSVSVEYTLSAGVTKKADSNLGSSETAAFYFDDSCTGLSNAITANITHPSTNGSGKNISCTGGADTTTFSVFIPKVTTFTDNSEPANTSRTLLGVGEKDTIFILPEGMGQINWTLSNNNGTLDLKTGPLVTFTAGEVAATNQVTATFVNGVKTNIPYTVIEPNGVYFVPYNYYLTKNPLTVGYDANIYYLPSTVNFSAIQVYEDTAPSIVTGYFNQLPYTNPHPKGNPSRMDVFVEGLGTKDLAHDMVRTILYPPPYTNGGTATWNIPWRYILGSTDKAFTNAVQQTVLTISNTGTNSIATLTISKFNSSATNTYP